MEKIAPMYDEKTGVARCVLACEQYDGFAQECILTGEQYTINQVCPIWAERVVYAIRLKGKAESPTPGMDSHVIEDLCWTYQQLINEYVPEGSAIDARGE